MGGEVQTQIEVSEVANYNFIFHYPHTVERPFHCLWIVLSTVCGMAVIEGVDNREFIIFRLFLLQATFYRQYFPKLSSAEWRFCSVFQGVHLAEVYHL